MVLMGEGEFICRSDVAVGEGEFRVDELFNDHISNEKMIFKQDLLVEIEFKHKSSTDTIFVFKQSLNIYPEDEQIYSKTDDDTFLFSDIIFRLSCSNYTGYNCQYDDIENEIYRTDFATGNIVCKNSTTCGSCKKIFMIKIVDSKCQTHELCGNGGTCYIKSDDNTFYCVCAEGFAGEYCEHSSCSFDEEELEFGKFMSIMSIREYNSLLH
ncbi:hypothetical protein HZS_4448 [Henneguya salminicola]|nr:hypothetical protein HZS_4448 [Henneguya salminicola]